MITEKGRYHPKAHAAGARAIAKNLDDEFLSLVLAVWPLLLLLLL